LGKGLCRRGDL